jgi:hypothetical protein
MTLRYASSGEECTPCSGSIGPRALTGWVWAIAASASRVLPTRWIRHGRNDVRVRGDVRLRDVHGADGRHARHHRPDRDVPIARAGLPDLPGGCLGDRDGDRRDLGDLGGADNVKGNGGDDVICGGDGPTPSTAATATTTSTVPRARTTSPGNGDDTLDGGLHNDSLRGGNGRDTCTSGEVRMSSCEL